MKFLENIPSYLFFTGKGGVGKTSISCATAIRLAELGKRVLLVSTDPASNVGQVFDQAIGNTIRPVTAVHGLSALEIDPQDAAQQYRARIVDPIKGLLPDDVVNSISEQLSGACTTEIAAFDEFTGLLTDASLLTRFDHIIFDTAPTGHTIRLLQLPGAWSSFIESNPDGASCLGPMAGLEKQREQYAHAVEALSDPERTRLVLVARLQKSTLQEVARTHEELSAIGLKNQYLVINGVLPKAEAEHDALAAAIWQREQEALANLPAGLSDLPTDNLYLQPLNMVGVPALKGLLNEHAEITSLPEQSPQNKPENMSLSVLVDDIARSEHGLIMLMGKGGVGKTTFAATLARLYADEGRKVLAADVDPDANLGLALGFDEETLDSIVPITKMRKLVEERTGANEVNKFFKINPKVDDIPDTYSKEVNGVKLLVLGTVETGGGGCVCPEHVMLRRIINNLVIHRDDVVIMDMEAGLEHLGRGTTQSMDQFIVVIEPGARSVQTYKNVKRLADDLGVKQVRVVANKVRNVEDEEFVKAHIPAEDLLGFIHYNTEVIDADRQGKSPYDFSNTVKEEITKIKNIIDKGL